MREQGGGSIINISSNVSKMAIPTIGAYAATKYALNGLTLTARSELAAEGIIVTAMHPARPLPTSAGTRQSTTAWRQRPRRQVDHTPHLTRPKTSPSESSKRSSRTPRSST